MNEPLGLGYLHVIKNYGPKFLEFRAVHTCNTGTYNMCGTDQLILLGRGVGAFENKIQVCSPCLLLQKQFAD